MNTERNKSISKTTRFRDIGRVKGTATQVIFYPGHMRFQIDREELDSAENVLLWIHHLSQMPWFTSDDLKKFIEACLETLPIHTKFPLWGLSRNPRKDYSKPKGGNVA